MRGSLGVQLGGQATQIFIQLATIPVFVSAWGVANYGVWLVLFAIPAYLTIGDLGLTHAGANIVVQKMSRGDRDAAIASYQALRTMVATLSFAIAVIALVVLGAFFPNLLRFADYATGNRSLATAMLLVCHGLAGLQIGVVYSGFRALDRFVPCGYAVLVIFLAEALVALCLALSGFGLFAVACAYSAVRVAGYLALAAALRAISPEFAKHRTTHLKAHFREIWIPASAGLALPIAGATVTQGIIIAIAAGGGTTAVPLFTTMRTLARVPAQLTQIVSRAAMPVLTVADAKGERTRRAELVMMMVIASVVVLIPGTLAIISIGPFFVEFWTLGKISPAYLLALVIGISALCNGCWQQMGDLLLAINKHGLYALFYLAAAVILVAAAYPLTRLFGVAGAASAIAALDVIMLAWMFFLCRRLGFFAPAELRHSWKSIRNRLYSWWQK